MTHKGKRRRSFTAGQVAAVVIAFILAVIAMTTHAGSEYTGKPAGQLLAETITQDPDCDSAGAVG